MTCSHRGRPYSASWISTNSRATVVSLFSGCGGLDLGAFQAGCDVIYGNDLDSDSAKSFSGLFPDALVDRRSILDVDQFPSADILTGGYPCQSFSMGGVRDPENDSRSFLYREFVRALGSVNPKIFVAENVSGLLSLDDGSHFRKQLHALRCAGKGYRVTWTRVKAQDYGVPQSRIRVIIVGVRRDIGGKFMFPSATHGIGLKPYRSHGDAISGLPLWPEGQFYERSSSSDDNFPWYFMSRNRKARWIDPSFTVVANWRHTTLHPASPSMELTWSRLQDGFKQRWDFSEEYEHIASRPSAPVLDRPRRLSWLECSLLQTFPRDFVPFGSVESKFRQIGNAVPAELSRVIFSHLLSGKGVVSA